jgi:hypothetical protein
MIRRWLGIEQCEPSPPIAQDVLHGSELAMVAYKIDNGYLLRIGGAMGMRSNLIYCTSEQEMAEKIIAHRAKEKIDARYGANKNYISGDQLYTVTLPTSLVLAKGESVTITA